MSRRILVWNAVGLVTVVALWLLLVPWDLSEVDAAGDVRSEGGNHAWPSLISVVMIVAAVGCGLAYRKRGEALSFLVGAYGTALLLFAWRTSVARTSGANLWVAGLLIVWLPGVTVAFSIAYLVGRLFARQRDSRWLS